MKIKKLIMAIVTVVCVCTVSVAFTACEGLPLGNFGGSVSESVKESVGEGETTSGEGNESKEEIPSVEEAPGEEETSSEGVSSSEEATPEETSSEEHICKYELVEYIRPTCMEEGREVYVCDCGMSYEGVFSKAEHNYETITITEPTCTKEGERIGRCIYCGRETEMYLPELGHNWEENCTYDDTHHWFGCSECDDVKDKQEHVDNGEGVCSVCGYLLTSTEGVVYELVDGVAMVTGYNGTATNVRIADTYKGVPVTAIGNSAFNNCANLTGIIIPDSVTSIGSYAFEGCGMTSVIIFDSVTGIGSYAFQNCDSLTSVEIFGNFGYGSGAFVSCDNLINMKIGDGVTRIPSGTFRGCSKLKSIVIPNSVTFVGNDAFANCYNLASVVIGDSVTKIEDKVFYSCNNLTSIYYKGNASEWNEIDIYSGNDKLTSATRYYYSESAPTEEGNYWYYDENGEVAVW